MSRVKPVVAVASATRPPGLGRRPARPGRERGHRAVRPLRRDPGGHRRRAVRRRPAARPPAAAGRPPGRRGGQLVGAVRAGRRRLPGERADRRRRLPARHQPAGRRARVRRRAGRRRRRRRGWTRWWWSSRRRCPASCPTRTPTSPPRWAASRWPARSRPWRRSCSASCRRACPAYPSVEEAVRALGRVASYADWLRRAARRAARAARRRPVRRRGGRTAGRPAGRVRHPGRAVRSPPSLDEALAAAASPRLPGGAEGRRRRAAAPHRPGRGPARPGRRGRRPSARTRELPAAFGPDVLVQSMVAARRGLHGRGGRGSGVRPGGRLRPGRRGQRVARRPGLAGRAADRPGRGGAGRRAPRGARCCTATAAPRRSTGTR